jgi:hypothetical protein
MWFSSGCIPAGWDLCESQQVEECDSDAGPHDGTYAGTIDINIAESGIRVNYGSCSAAISLIVTDSGSPQISGPVSCTVSELASQLSLNFEGSITTDPQVAGTVGLDYNNGSITDNTAWSGAFSGEELSGSFSGQYQLGTQGLTWSGSFTATR